MNNIQILFFGKLKDTWDTDNIKLIVQYNDIESLYAELLDQIKIPPFKDNIKVAINGKFASWNSKFTDGDVIAFLPPASGG